MPAARPCAVSSGVTRYGWVPAVRVRASSSIFGPSAASTRSASASGVVGGVETVEVAGHRLHRILVGAGRVDVVDQRPVADPHAAQEARTVLGRQRGVLGGRLLRGVHPDVEDAGGDRRRRRRAQQVVEGAEHVAADVGDPQRRVTEAPRARRPVPPPRQGRRSGAWGSRCQFRTGESSSSHRDSFTSPPQSPAVDARFGSPSLRRRIVARVGRTAIGDLEASTRHDIGRKANEDRLVSPVPRIQRKVDRIGVLVSIVDLDRGALEHDAESQPVGLPVGFERHRRPLGDRRQLRPRRLRKTIDP